jgi:hypothetical protein
LKKGTISVNFYRSEVEDKFHFSMICDKLKDIRDKFFKKLTDIEPLFSNFSDLDKFFFIFRSNDYDINMCCIKHILFAKFIFLCLPFSIIRVLLLILILIKFETSDLTMSNLRKFSIS